MPSPYLINRPEISESAVIQSAESMSLRNSIYLSDQPLQTIRTSNPSLTLTHPTQEGESNKRVKTWHALQNILKRFWLWEFAACLLSLACLAAICGVLSYENGRRLDQWRLLIPPNAVVSFIATLAKSSLVLVLSQVLSQLKWVNLGSAQRLDYFRKFDSASRGPIGSLVLLCTSKHFLASLAASLMLLSLLVDPFVQIVFLFPSELVTDPTQQSTFPSCSVLDPLSRQDILNIKTTTSINNGLIDAPFLEAFTCPSGNCLWPDDIKTLGLCGYCNNVTTELQRNCTTGSTETLGGILTYCTYTFPSGQTRDMYGLIVPENQVPNNTLSSNATMHDFTTWNSTVSNLCSHILANFTLPTHNNRTVTHWPVFKYAFGCFEVLRNQEVNPDMLEDHDPIDLINAQGYECGFNWCEKTYSNVQVIGGVLSYTSTKETLWGFCTYDDFDSCYLFLPNQLAELQKSASIHSIPYKLRGQVDSIEYVPNVIFIFDDSVAHVDGGPGWVGPRFSTIKSVLEAQPDLHVTMSKLGDRLTEMIRTMNGTDVLGQTQVSVPLIRVRWGWLALPLALLVTTSMLLAVVAFKSHSSKTAVWKEDPLALIFHRIDGLNPSLLSKTANPGPIDIENLASEIVIKMSPDAPYKFVMSSLDKKERTSRNTVASLNLWQEY